MEPRLIKCFECHGICETCNGDGTIPDPDEFVNTLNDLVTAKEITYED